jgi:hypothetical protein
MRYTYDDTDLILRSGDIEKHPGPMYNLLTIVSNISKLNLNTTASTNADEDA